MPGNNLLKVGGLTLVERAVKAAHDSGVIDIVLVSSEDDAILKHANSLGSVVAHRRTVFAATENSSAGDVMRDLFDSDHDDVFISEDNSPWFVYLKPTSALRTGQHILEAFQELVQFPAVEAIVSVSSANQNQPNGAIYIFSHEEFLKTGSLPDAGSLRLVMSEAHSLKVRSKEDAKKAEALLD